jgi:energy-coupling factor transporter ATP-binding protein EcfA2
LDIVSPQPKATNVRQENASSLDVRNAYYLSISLRNIRCFGESQVLSLRDAAGHPARWTLILGDNGVGKTTLMQLLALGAAVEIMVSSEDSEHLPIAVPRLAEHNPTQLRELGRRGQTVNEVSYKTLWAESLDQSEDDSQDESKVVRNTGGRNVFFFKHHWRSVIYGYGANRRRAPKGLTSEASDDPTQTLFDDDATLRNPEEWLLQNELVARVRRSRRRSRPAR